MISALIMLGYLSIAVFGGEPAGALLIISSLLLPLLCIWFPEALAGATGYIGGGRWITRESPPAAIAFFGWVVFLLPIVAVLLSLLLEE